jgi:hypothetical membrane protein
VARTDWVRAGATLFIGTVQFVTLMTVSEVLYSANGLGGYSVSTNYISDLGANCSGGGACYIPPSALLFNSSVAALGLLALLGAYFLLRASNAVLPSVMLSLTGVGALGVGLFPETAGVLHDLFSLVAFFFAALSALVASRLQKPPASYMSLALGAVTLGTLVLYSSGAYLGLGAGGMERMVVVPAALWGVGFGGYLMSVPAEPSRDAAPSGKT